MDQSWRASEMSNCCENRFEVSFANSESEAIWKARYVSFEHDKQWLNITVGTSESDVKGDSSARQSFAKITDEDRGDNDSLIFYCDSRWAPPSCWFSELVKVNPSITTATLEYSEANKCFVGSMAFDRSTNTITETYRCGEDLTADDWTLLGHDRCEDCSEFLCKCD
jgi:hypothetical protein